MDMDVLGRWLRGLFSIALLVAAILMIRQWYVDLPREARRLDATTGAPVVTPLRSAADRIGAWKPGANRPTAWLAGGLLALALTFLGRFVSPLLWRRRGTPPHLAPRRVHHWKTPRGTIEVDEHGKADGPPLVLVHGLGSDRTLWLETIADLQRDHRVFVFDLPGHGRAARDGKRDDFTIEGAAERLDAIVRNVGEAGLVLVGHSMGGMIAMHWCETRHPGAAPIAGLVLAHTTPRNPFTTMAPVGLHRALLPLYDAWLRVVPALSGLVRVLQRLEYWNGSLHWQSDRQGFAGTETREQLDRSARASARSTPAATATFTRSMIRFDARLGLRALDVRTLIVAGDRDPVTVPEASREIADPLPDGELVVIPNARHLGFLERRREFADAVARFAGDAGASRRSRAAR